MRMPDVSEDEWKRLWRGAEEISAWFPDGCAFIGGLAVYAHCQDKGGLEKFAAFSHDADLVIVRADFMDLRDLEEVSANRRLGKHQFIKNDFEFDVYEEGSSGLIVPVPEIIAASSLRHGIRVASPEHLLALKLEAYKDRQRSSKGDKDAEDVVRLVAILAKEPIYAHRLKYLSDEHLDLLARTRSTATLLRMNGGNSFEAARLGEVFDAGREEIHAGLERLAKDPKERSDASDRPKTSKSGIGE